MVVYADSAVEITHAYAMKTFLVKTVTKVINLSTSCLIYPSTWIYTLKSNIRYVNSTNECNMCKLASF